MEKPPYPEEMEHDAIGLEQVHANEVLEQEPAHFELKKYNKKNNHLLYKKELMKSLRNSVFLKKLSRNIRLKMV